MPGLPTAVGPFGVFDTRAYLSQTVLDLRSLNQTHAATEGVKAAEYSYKDARDLVVLAAGNAYLKVLASAARVETAEAQVKTAQTLSDKTSDQQKAGVSPAIDTLRAKVEWQSRKQSLIAARNDLAKDKLTLARVIGLAMGQQFEASEQMPYDPLTKLDLDQSLARAYATRPDYQGAKAKLSAAEFSRKAAKAQSQRARKVRRCYLLTRR